MQSESDPLTDTDRVRCTHSISYSFHRNGQDIGLVQNPDGSDIHMV